MSHLYCMVIVNVICCKYIVERGTGYEKRDKDYKEGI